MKLPERIFALCKAEKITRKDLANDIDTDHSNVYRWSFGKTQPSVANVIKICEMYGISADWLLGLSDEGGPYDNDKYS